MRGKEYGQTICSKLKGHCVIPHAELVPGGLLFFGEFSYLIGPDGEKTTWHVDEPGCEKDRAE